jgi:hypothetical protein
LTSPFGVGARSIDGEVPVDDDGPAALELAFQRPPHERERRATELLRPGDVTRAERLEERLLDRVLGDQRKSEPVGDEAGDERLAARRRARHEDDRRRCAHGVAA